MNLILWGEYWWVDTLINYPEETPIDGWISSYLSCICLCQQCRSRRPYNQRTCWLYIGELTSWHKTFLELLFHTYWAFWGFLLSQIKEKIKIEGKKKGGKEGGREEGEREREAARKGNTSAKLREKGTLVPDFLDTYFGVQGWLINISKQLQEVHDYLSFWSQFLHEWASWD